MVITNGQLEKLFKQHDDVRYVKAEGDGYHYQVTIVSDEFAGKSKLARQKWVYSVLNKHIVAGDLHAIHMHTYTVSEWEEQRG